MVRRYRLPVPEYFTSRVSKRDRINDRLFADNWRTSHRRSTRGRFSRRPVTFITRSTVSCELTVKVCWRPSTGRLARPPTALQNAATRQHAGERSGSARSRHEQFGDELPCGNPGRQRAERRPELGNRLETVLARRCRPAPDQRRSGDEAGLIGDDKRSQQSVMDKTE